MLTGQRCRSHGARRKRHVLKLLTRAANSEPAGRLHPCKKSSDAELLFGGEGDEPDTRPLIPNTVWIRKHTGDGSLQEFCQRCQIKASWGGSRNVQGCLDLQRVWVLVGISMLVIYFVHLAGFDSSEGSGAGTWQLLQTTVFESIQWVFGKLMAYFTRFNISGFQKKLSSQSPESHLWHLLWSQELVFILKRKLNVNN